MLISITGVFMEHQGLQSEDLLNLLFFLSNLLRNVKFSEARLLAVMLRGKLISEQLNKISIFKRPYEYISIINNNRIANKG